MDYTAAADRYTNGMKYNRCGRSGIILPAISLGLWHNFGDIDNQEEAEKMILYAFDHGITHIDIANNYGPLPDRQKAISVKYSRNNCRDTATS